MILVDGTQQFTLTDTPTYQTATSEDIYREFGQEFEMIEPAAGEYAHYDQTIWEIYGYINMPAPPKNALTNVSIGL